MNTLMQLVDADLKLRGALQDWHFAGGALQDVVDAIRNMIDVRVAAALSESQGGES